MQNEFIIHDSIRGSNPQIPREIHAYHNERKGWHSFIQLIDCPAPFRMERHRHRDVVIVIAVTFLDCKGRLILFSRMSPPRGACLSASLVNSIMHTLYLLFISPLAPVHSFLLFSFSFCYIENGLIHSPLCAGTECIVCNTSEWW